jgi:hypothetical protein
VPDLAQIRGIEQEGEVSMMVSRNLRRCPGTALILAAGFLGSGCMGGGDDLPRVAVSGTVTFDGKPLEKGTIRFLPSAKGKQGVALEGGGMIESGKFSIPRDQGLVPGTYQVAIFSGGSGKGRGANGPETGGPAPSKELIPAKYNAKSELPAEVKQEGSNDFNFELTSK